jgi:hypothetical protein
MGVAVSLTFGAACGDDAGGGGDDSSDDSSRPTTDEATTTSTTTLTPEEAAKATYLEFVETVDRLVTTNPDPDDPDLAELAIDPVLGTVRDSLTTMQAENHIWRTGARSSHAVTSVELREPTTVTLRDCYVGNDTRLDRDDNSIVSSGLSTELLDVTLTLGDESSWVVSMVTTAQTFEGEVECPA